MNQNETTPPSSSTLGLTEAQAHPDTPIVPGGLSLNALRLLSEYTRNSVGAYTPRGGERPELKIAMFRAQFPRNAVGPASVRSAPSA